MSENDKIPSRLTHEESHSEKNHVKETTEQKQSYPVQEEREGADNEQIIINNSNGNGINPNPAESGNNPEWIDGRK